MLEADASAGGPGSAGAPLGSVGALAETDGRGSPAGNSRAHDGRGERRRRSSVLVVELNEQDESKGALARITVAMMQQVRLTLMAFGLVLIMAPVVAIFEPCVAYMTKSLPNFVSSASCRGLLSEGRGVDLLVCAALGFFLNTGAFFIASVDANPRSSRMLRHQVPAAAASAAYTYMYASAVSSRGDLEMVVGVLLAGFIVASMPLLSHAVYSFATAARRSLRRAAHQVVFAIAFGVLSVVLGAIATTYVSLSKFVSGWKGVAINGICCPLMLVGVRHGAALIIHAKVSGAAMDFAGVLVMLMAIVTSTPQFYVLAMIDDGTPQFIASAVASAASEWMGAAVAARVAHHKLAEAALRTWDKRSSRVVPARLRPSVVLSGAQPSEGAQSSSRPDSRPDPAREGPATTSALTNRASDGPADPSPEIELANARDGPAIPSQAVKLASPARDGPANSSQAVKLTNHARDGSAGPSQAVKLASHADSPADQDEAAARRKLLIATRVAHADVGEKAALLLGCAAAIWISGLSLELTARAFALVLLEAVADHAKAATYAAGGINVRSIGLNFHFLTLLGIALTGGTSCATLFLAVRIECWISESVGRAEG
jgi:hypothetical protein